MGKHEPTDPIRVIMSAPVVSVSANTTLASLGERLARAGVGAAAVMDGDQLVGIASERDIARALGAGAVPDDVWVADVMSAPPTTVAPDEQIADAATRMLDGGVRHLPVVDAGSLVGIVSERDVLAVLDATWRRQHPESNWDTWLDAP